MRGLVALATALFMALPAGAQDATVFAGLEGGWRGAGIARPVPGDPAERTRCSLEAERDGDTLIIAGRCAVAAGAAQLTLKLVDDGDGRMRAGFASPVFEDTVQYAGTYAATELTLETRSPITVEDRAYDKRIRLTVTPEGMTMVEQTRPTDGGDWTETARLVFTRTTPDA